MIGLEIRKESLFTSLILEKMMTIFLAELLDISDTDQSLSFSNRGTALSFAQKIYLLIDIGALAPERRTKFIKFMEMRNQFMHNLDADTYVKCFSYLGNWIIKNYPPDEGDYANEEEMFEASARKLYSDVLGTTKEIMDVVVKKKTEVHKEKLDFSLEFVRALVKYSKDTTEKIKEITNKEEKVKFREIKKVQDEGLKELQISVLKKYLKKE